MAELRVYEYVIGSGKNAYLGSYTVKAGCPKEKELQEHYNAKLVVNKKYRY